MQTLFFAGGSAGFFSMLIGCSDPEIDASNEQSLQFSLDHIRSPLADEDRIVFDTALVDLNDMLFNTTDAISQATISLCLPDALIRKILPGKTAHEVIAMVEKHRR